MTIDAACPHCETVFHLKPEMVGTAMRCPECREIFSVEPKTALPYERIERAQAVDLLDAPPVAVAPSLPSAIPLPEIPVAAAAAPLAEAIPVGRPLPIVPKAKPAKAAKPPKADAPKVVDWRSAAPPVAPTASPLNTPSRTPLPAELEAPPSPKRNLMPLVLTGLITLLLLMGGGTVGKLIYDKYREEELLSKEADAAHKERNYPQAVKLYDEVIAKFPESGKKPSYEFFQALSTLHVAMASPTLREEPQAARSKWEAFLKDHSTSPLAKTDDGYGVDIFDAGRKLIEGYLGAAEDRLRTYRSERVKLQNLATAEKIAADAGPLFAVVDRYRPADIKPLEELKAKFGSLNGEFRRERVRLDILAPYRDLAENPVDDRIAEFVATLARTGFAADSEAQSLISTATAKLRSLLKPVADAAPPVSVAKEADFAVTASAGPAGRVAPLPPPPGAIVQTVFASARGRLFAFDADTGARLWSAFTGRDGVTPLTRFTVNESEFVLVPSLRDGQAALAARLARTGELHWHQPLPAPLAGTPVVIGARVYVPLADALGTLVEFDVVTGHRVSTLAIRQWIGPGAVHVPGTTRLLVTAEARRLFLIDVAPQSTDGDRLPMRLLHVLTTNHPPRSVRVPPVFCGTGDGGAKSMVLLQSDGTTGTLIRAIAVPESTPPADAIAQESTAVELGMATLPGLVAFPPASDGDRVAVVTDTGAFAVYSTNAPGNLDPGLFAWPASAMTAAKDPVPAAAISAGEDAIWIFAQGKRLPLKLSLLPATGLKYLPRGTPQPWGVPLEPPTLLPRNSLACATVRSDDFDTASAVLFDVNTGRVKWERTLGLPAAAPPVPVSGGAIVVDTAAGIARVADAATTLAEPVQPAMTAALVATAGERVWAVIAESPEANGVRLRVRCVEAGRLTIDVSLAVPKGLAGAPMPISDDLLLALKDGFLHRFSSISKQLSTGPMWRDAVAEKSATCLAAVQGDTILASDGGRRVGRWRWPATTAWSVIGPPLVARGEVVLPPLALDNRVLVAEAAALSLFDVAKPEEPVRRWRSPAMPAGTPRLGVTAFGKLAIIALDARHVVAIDPDSPTPAWMIERPAADSDLAGMSVANGELIVTDLLGAVQRISPAGKVLGRIAPRSRDWLPRTAAAVSGSAVFLPTVDGAVLKLPFMKGSP